MTGGTDKKQRVGAMFDSIAPTYDVLNHLMSMGIDRGWRRKVVKMVGDLQNKRSSGPHSGCPQPTPGEQPVNCSAIQILDIATGTGDLAIAIARAIPTAQITGIDISEKMLAVAREKVKSAGLLRDKTPRNDGGGGSLQETALHITLTTGDAENLQFPDASFDAVTVAFGVRNFGDIPRGLAEMKRVLRPGGRCIVLELSRPTLPIFAWIFRLYFHRLLPLVGRIVSHDRAAYSYLPDSVDHFPPPDQFAEMMRAAGFSTTHSHSLTGGVAHVFEGISQ
jgi:demethylmenaquinone methyltransferase/2-methoxy-6-polyprenyl-1,4-benzoquinol methylase